MSYIPYFLVIALIVSPLLGLAGLSLVQGTDVFSFLVTHVLFETTVNSALIVALVFIGTFTIGTASAWLISRYRFWGDGVLQWALLIPMAFPAYIVAYAYTDLLDLVLQDIRSPVGAAVIMTLCLYPYVYIFACNAFKKQAQNQLDAAALLGASAWRQFFTVALPSARPFILVGLALVTMETLADYGTVSYFGVRVFSTMIYNAWASYGDIYAAARLSLILLAFMLVVLFLERQNRARIRFFDLSAHDNKPVTKTQLFGVQSGVAAVLCWLPVLAGFVVPFLILLKLAAEDIAQSQSISGFVFAALPAISNTLIVALSVGVLGVLIALGLGMIKRDHTSRWIDRFYQISGFGYALPGVILGLGLLIVSGFVQTHTGLLVSGSFGFLVGGYLIRFLVIPLQSLDAAFDKISPGVDQASQLLRQNKLSEFWYIRMPLLRPALMSAFMLLVVDVIKELPLTLILRPFNYETLAVRAYHLASDERLIQAAFPSLLIALSGLIPVLIISRFMRST